jgi:hypothetical protein
MSPDRRWNAVELTRADAGRKVQHATGRSRESLQCMSLLLAINRLSQCTRLMFAFGSKRTSVGDSEMSGSARCIVKAHFTDVLH